MMMLHQQVDCLFILCCCVCCLALFCLLHDQLPSLEHEIKERNIEPYLSRIMVWHCASLTCALSMSTGVCAVPDRPLSLLFLHSIILSFSNQ